MICLGISFQAAYSQDKAGTKDHPLISRYEGFKLEKTLDLDFELYKLPLGPAVSNNELGEHVALEGKVSKLWYTFGPELRPSLYQVFKNYEAE